MSKLIISLYILFTSGALVVLKLGTKHGAPVESIANKLQFNINAYTIIGVLMYGISFLLYTYLISKYDLGYIIPLTTAFVYVLIFTASLLIFKEVFTVFKIIGITFVFLGIVFLNIKN